MKTYHYTGKPGSSPTNEQPPENARGFEMVWLSDMDQIHAAAKEWMQEPESTASKSTSLSAWTVAVSYDYEYVACGSSEGLIFVWRLETEPDVCDLSYRSMKRVTTLSGHKGGVIRLQWNQCKERRVLLSCAFDGTVRVWSVLSGKPGPLCILKCGPDLPVGISFVGEDDSQALVTCLDGATRVISFTPPPSTCKNGNQHEEEPALIDCKVEGSFLSNDAATHMSISPSGRYLAVGSQCGVVTLSDLSTHRVIREIQCRNHFGRHKQGEKITGISWDHTSTYIAVTTRDGRIRVFDTNDPSKWIKLKAKSDPRLVAIFDPSGRFVLAAAENGHVYVWDLWRASQNPIRKRARLPKLLSRRRSSSTQLDSPPSGLNLESLDDDQKRETAYPVASFSAEKSPTTAMCMIPYHQADLPCQAARVVLGSEDGSVGIYVILLSN